MNDQDLGHTYGAVRQRTDAWQSTMLALTREQSRQAFTVGGGTEEDPAMVPEVTVTPKGKEIILPTPEDAAAEAQARLETQPKQGVEAVLDAAVAEQEFAFGALTGNFEKGSQTPKRVPLLDFMDKMGAQQVLDKIVELTGSEQLAASIVTLPAVAVGVLLDPLNMGAAGRAGKELAKQGVKLTKKMRATFDQAQEELVKLYHGSPHKFDQFSIEKIGTGEGAQAYGHGIYIAENQEVAKNYAPRDFPLEKKLMRSYKAAEFANDIDMMEILEAAMMHDTPAQIISRFAGRGAAVEKKAANVAQFIQDNAKAFSLYEVTVPKKAIDTMLDWDKPLGEQPESVRTILKQLPAGKISADGLDMSGGAKILDNRNGLVKPGSSAPWVLKSKDKLFDLTQKDIDRMLEGDSGGAAYTRLTSILGSQKAASDYLASKGIPGIKYLDQGSRGSGEGTRNFVLFDDALVKVVKRNDKNVTEILKNERGSIQVTKDTPAKVSTPVTWEEAVQIDDLQRAFDERLTSFSERLSKQRRGVRSDVQVGAEASQLQQDRLDLEGLLRLEPGTILNDAETVAVRRMFKDTAEPVRQLGAWMKANPNDQQAFMALLKQLDNVDESLTRIAGVYAESGRTQRLLNADLPTTGMIPAATPERVRISDPYIQQWLRFFQGQEELAKLGAPALTQAAFIDMVAAIKSPEQLARLAKGMADPTWGDMLAQVYIQSLLSGLAPVKNIMGNPVILASQIAMRPVAAGVSAVTGAGKWMLGQGFTRDTYFGETGAMLRGAAGSLGDAFRVAWQSMLEGRPLSRGESVEPMRNAITGDVLGLTGMWGRAVDFIGHVVNLPGTSLLGGDELFKTIAWRAEQRALALRKAHETVIGSHATGDQASRIFKDTMQRIVDNPTDYPEIKEAAQDFATYVTLQQELGPMGKSVQTWATTARTATGLPVGRFVMPFTTIATNAPRMAGEHSPLALASKLVWDEINAGGARRDMALAKIAAGTAIMTVFADLASQGLITGAGPRDKDARMHRHDATGWQAGSVMVGGRYVSVQAMEPWSTMASTVADLTEMYAHAETEEQRGKIMNAMIAVNYAIARNVTSKTYLMGAVGLGNAAISGDIENFNQFAKQMASGLIPYSGALRQITAIEDPVMRQAVDMVDAVKKELPGWSDTLRPMRNFWGDEIIREGGFGWDFYNPLYVSSRRDDKVSQEFTRLEYFPPMPGKQIDGVPLTETKHGELDAYIRLSQSLPIIGNMTLHQRLEQTVTSDLYKMATDGPDGGKVVLLRDVIDDYRNFAQAILHSKELSQQFLGYDFPELRAQFDLVDQDRANRFNAPVKPTKPAGAATVTPQIQ